MYPTYVPFLDSRTQERLPQLRSMQERTGPGWRGIYDKAEASTQSPHTPHSIRTKRLVSDVNYAAGV